MAVDDAFIKQADPASPRPSRSSSPEQSRFLPCRRPLSLPPDVCPRHRSHRAGATVQQIADAIVGYCLDAAQELAKSFGYEVRVVRQDGVDLPITDDLVPTRINVEVDNDAVTAVVSIG